MNVHERTRFEMMSSTNIYTTKMSLATDDDYALHVPRENRDVSVLQLSLQQCASRRQGSPTCRLLHTGAVGIGSGSVGPGTGSGKSSSTGTGAGGAGTVGAGAVGSGAVGAGAVGTIGVGTGAAGTGALVGPLVGELVGPPVD
jgi:hypothetical protein